MTIDRAAIECRVPQTGAMCLLDAVSEWNAERIVCNARAPDAGHPLARGARLPAAAAIEYAAQATAVHGTLLEGRARPHNGMLASLSDVEMHCADIALGDGPLQVVAELVSRAAAGCIYAFDVATPAGRVVSGRLMVAFIAPDEA